MQQPRLLDRVKDAIRIRHYSLRTEPSYVGWVRRFILFNNKRHPQEMGAAENSPPGCLRPKTQNAAGA